VTVAQRLTHRYRPRGVFARALTFKGDELLLAGPAGTGKSRALLELLMLRAIKYPKSQHLALRKTAVSLAATGMQTWEKFVVPELMAAGKVIYFGGSKREPAAYRFWNGSRVAMGGMDNPTKIMSGEYDSIYCQEATEFMIDDWEAAISRLRNGGMPYQQINGDCNPDAPEHFLYQRQAGGPLAMWHTVHEDNPVLFNDDGTVTERGESYMRKLDALTGVRYQRLRLGLWVAAEGVIYEQWSSARHLVDRYDVPREWPRYWVIDFGYVNPMVVQFWAEKPDGDLVMYREVYTTGRTVDEVARLVLEQVATLRDSADRAHPKSEDWVWTEPRPQAVVCDHDAEGRAVWTRETGLVTRAAKKDVLDGIQAAQVRLRDGRATFMRDSLCHPRDQDLVDRFRPASTVEEFPGYVWLKKGPSTDKREQDEPHKEDDHGMDCFRYLCMARDPRFRPGVRFLGGR
jgi:PBSX family phage terminase large subunit